MGNRKAELNLSYQTALQAIISREIRPWLCSKSFDTLLRSAGKARCAYAVGACTSQKMDEGAEVSQLYERQMSSSVPRPDKELKGFAKTTLKPGESRVVRIRVSGRDLGFWDVTTHDWKTEPGEFRILVGGASDQIALQGSFSVE